MHTIENSSAYTPGEIALSILVGWTAPEPAPLSPDDRWNIVSVALRSAGCANPRPVQQHRAEG